MAPNKRKFQPAASSENITRRKRVPVSAEHPQALTSKQAPANAARKALAAKSAHLPSSSWDAAVRTCEILEINCSGLSKNSVATREKASLQSLKGMLCKKRTRVNKRGGRNNLLIHPQSNIVSLIDVMMLLATSLPLVEELLIRTHTLCIDVTNLPKLKIVPRLHSLNVWCMQKVFTLKDLLRFLSHSFPNVKSLMLDGYLVSTITERQTGSVEVHSLETVNISCFLGSKPLDAVFVFLAESCPNLKKLVFSSCRIPWPSASGLRQIISVKMENLTKLLLYPHDEIYPLDSLISLVNELQCPQLRYIEVKAHAFKVDDEFKITHIIWSKLPSRSEVDVKCANKPICIAMLILFLTTGIKDLTVLTVTVQTISLSRGQKILGDSMQGRFSLKYLRLCDVEQNFRKAHLQAVLNPLCSGALEITVNDDNPEDLPAGRKGSLRTLSTSLTPNRIYMPKSESFCAKRNILQSDNDSSEEEENMIPTPKRTQASAIDDAQTRHEQNSLKNELPLTICEKLIGSEGGVLNVQAYGVKLEIPTGAITGQEPKLITLKALTGKPPITDDKEMYASPGFQCTPHGLTFQTAVTLTISHCAIISLPSRARAVLYSADGDYNEGMTMTGPVPLGAKGTPSCVISKDEIKLKVNHFSLGFIVFVKNFFFRGKRICCLPYMPIEMPVARYPIILRVHLYDDTPGLSEDVRREEIKLGFAKMCPETLMFINAKQPKGLTVDCFLLKQKEGSESLSFEHIHSLPKNYVSFTLNLSAVEVPVGVSLKVAQDEEKMLVFSYPSSRPKTRSKVTNVYQKFEEMGDIIELIAKEIHEVDEIEKLGKSLNFKQGEIANYLKTNTRNEDVTHNGTLRMLRKWRRKVPVSKERDQLKEALIKSEQFNLASRCFPEVDCDDEISRHQDSE